MHRARCPEQEERLVRINRDVRSDVLNGLVSEVGGEVVILLAHPGLGRCVIVEEQRPVIVRICRHEPIEVVEALAKPYE